MDDSIQRTKRATEFLVENVRTTFFRTSPHRDTELRLLPVVDGQTFQQQTPVTRARYLRKSRNLEGEYSRPPNLCAVQDMVDDLLADGIESVCEMVAASSSAALG